MVGYSAVAVGCASSQNLVMGWRKCVAAIGLTIVILTGCGGRIDVARPVGSPKAAEAVTSIAATADSLQPLRSRSLHLPQPTPGVQCPVSTGQSKQVNLPNTPRKWPKFGFGTGPVYLSGDAAWYAQGGALFLVSPDASGPILLRGTRIDGAPAWLFDVPSNTSSDRPHELVLWPMTGSPQWRMGGGEFGSVPAGCYGVQADGASFSEIILFQIRPGQPPPG
jgi:hypothetical protein